MYLAKLFFILPLMLQQADAPLDKVANQIVKQINDQSQHIARIYHPGLLKQVSEAQLLALYKDFATKHGRIVGIHAKKRTVPESGQFTLTFEKGVEMQMTLTIDRQTPPRIVSIWFSPPVSSFKDIASIIKEIKKLPGRVNFEIARLDDKLTVTHTLHADQALAIGSTFKLYLLGTIVAKKRPWDDVVKLEDRYKSLPSGILQTWPDGSPVTLHTLATEMISISDNTAADHVLYTLGRETVESQMAKIGNSNPERSWPMLSTLEMFKIKSNAALIKQYTQSNIDERRRLLDGRIGQMSRAGLAPFSEGKPIAIEKVEWFASADDLCRAMNWFHQKKDETALSILAINPGATSMRSEFDYIGYKGGSEPGVLNFTWLLRTKKGTHFALSMGWNNPAKEGVDLEKFLGLGRSALRILASR